MKKIILTLVFVMVAQFNFASVNDSILSQARKYFQQENYEEAINAYKQFLRTTSENDLKDVYVELANSYFKNNDKKNAVNAIKNAIMKYGFNETDFIYNQTILPKLSDYALAQLYDDLDGLHDKYLATLD